MRSIFKCTYFLFFMMILFTNKAYGYLDPSSTSYIIQAVAGVFIAGGAAIGIYWHKIKRWIKNRKQK